MRKIRAIELAAGTVPSGDAEARTALTWTLRRVLPPQEDVATALETAEGRRIVAALHGGILYRFSLSEPGEVDYTVSHLSPHGSRVRATVSYTHDATWTGPVSHTRWEFSLGADDVLCFSSSHNVQGRPEGAELLARLIAERLGHPVYGEPSDA